MAMIEGWLLDLHENQFQTGMMVWIVDDDGLAHGCEVLWRASLHVHATTDELTRLTAWLSLPEITARFGITGISNRAMRLDLESDERANVLEVFIEPFRHLRALAEHIEARGEFHRYTLFSVDAHLVQRFLNEHQCEPFSRVRWVDGVLHPVSKAATTSVEPFPPFRVVQLAIDFAPSHGPPSLHDAVQAFRLKPVQEPGFDRACFPVQETILSREHFDSFASMFEAFQRVYDRMDPDVVLTYGGDQRLFPWLVQQGKLLGHEVRLGRTLTALAPSTQARTVQSYGHTLHRHGAFFLEGRLHLDLRNGFIVKEGGASGLFELAQHSSQSAQVISRLSPGSVISAIQMRVAMDDGVLVPWKKNRPEDTKSALELLYADRGGLYLDSRPGVYASVIELDFASLFPSIIATRNISPETLNCACCQPPSQANGSAIVPLHPSDAEVEFRHRRLRSQFGHGLFPMAHEKALRVPGLSSYTCGRRHGFLGRVVAPIIERRSVLKRQRKEKGDVFDLRQNALKWLLVTCFGYTGYRNARFGRIEAHEAICAWSREILLTTIEEAQLDGWDVLHAIVDCVWLLDRNQRTLEQQQQDAAAFAARMSVRIGIPLELEQHYDFIAFLPSRVHGAGSLTKYWAYGGGEFKVRGIEMRQHSTPPWIGSLQEQALHILATSDRDNGLPNRAGQQRVLRFYREECQRLERREIPLDALIVTRRVTSTLGSYQVKNLTYAALMRAHQLGYQVPPGGKIRYVVVNVSASEPLERVVLAEELPSSATISACASHYNTLAERAVWAILAPFGWSEEDLRGIGRQPTLYEFSGLHAATPAIQPKQETFDEVRIGE